MSYGKRRRRRSALTQTGGDGSVDGQDEEGTQFIFDPNLGQEVIYFATPLRKQIRVESGTKIDEVSQQDSSSGLRVASAGPGGKKK